MFFSHNNQITFAAAVQLTGASYNLAGETKSMLFYFIYNSHWPQVEFFCNYFYLTPAEVHLLSHSTKQIVKKLHIYYVFSAIWHRNRDDLKKFLSFMERLTLTSQFPLLPKPRA